MFSNLNHKLFGRIFSTGLMMLLFTPYMAQAQELPRYIITLNGPPQKVIDAVKARGGNINHVYSIIQAIAVRIPEPALEGLRHNPLVKQIEPDVIVTATAGQPTAGISALPAQKIPWGVDKIDAELAWSTAKGAGVKVAVIDTGIEKTHPDLSGNIKGGVNFVVRQGKVYPNFWGDDNGHGTHVAGIIGAMDNSIGTVGVAPLVSLYAVKVLNKSGSGYLSDIIAGIDWAVKNNMDIINMSLGTQQYVAAFENACNTAYNNGVLIVAAAGNDGDTNPDNDVDYPGAFQSVIAVAATDINNQRASFSSDGPEVEISAPGVQIFSTWKGGSFSTLSGTSMASPHVAGVAALILSQPSVYYDINSNGIWENDEIRSWLGDTSDYIGPEYYTGKGLVDAEEASTGVSTNP